jgi:hypothetical protein
VSLHLFRVGLVLSLQEVSRPKTQKETADIGDESQGERNEEEDAPGASGDRCAQGPVILAPKAENVEPANDPMPVGLSHHVQGDRLAIIGVPAKERAQEIPGSGRIVSRQCDASGDPQHIGGIRGELERRQDILLGRYAAL